MLKIKTNNGFKFNLLPRKSRLETVLVQERDSSIFYATAIVLFASIVWLISAVVLNQLALPRLQAAKAEVAAVEAQTKALSDTQAKFGEVILKSKILSPLLDKKVNTDLIFEVANSLINTTGRTGVISYRREADGKFVFRVTTDNFNTVAQVMENARKLETISNLELRNSSLEVATGLVNSTIALNINGLNK